MLIYYFVFLLSFLLCIFDFVGRHKTKLYVFTGFVFFVTAVVGFRNVGVDNDSSGYFDLFQNITNYSFWEIISGDYPYNREIGYMLLNKIVMLLGFDFRSILLFMAIISAVLTYTFIWKFSPYPFISVLFYLSFFYLYRDFTQIRYGFCCAILFWAIWFYDKKKYALFFTLWFIAFLFHKTALVVVILLPFLKLNIRYRYWFLFPIICSFGMFLNVADLFLFIKSYSYIIAFYMNEESKSGFMLSIIGYLIMVLYYFLSAGLKEKDSTELYTLYFRLLSLAVGLNLLFFQLSVFQRFDYLFFQFSVILLPVLLQQLTKLKYSYFKTAYILFAIVFFLYGCKMIDSDLVKPYVFTLN